MWEKKEQQLYIEHKHRKFRGYVRLLSDSYVKKKQEQFSKGLYHGDLLF